MKGFTLLELVIVLIIVGIGASIALPNLYTSIEQTKAQTAENTLLAISAAQQKYFEDTTPNVYCAGSGGASCGGTTASLFSALRMSSSSSDAFTYICYDAAPYTCTATDGTDTLTLTYTLASGAVVTCTASGNNCLPNG